MNTPISLHDEFDTSTGEFPNYDAYDIAQHEQLGIQKHTDIRSFFNDVQDAVLTTIPVIYMDLLDMHALDNKTMNDLEGAVTVRPGERWTNGTVGKQSDRNNWHGITLTCPAGTTTSTISVITLALDS